MGGWGQHDPGILRMRLGKLRKVAHCAARNQQTHIGTSVQRVQRVQSVFRVGIPPLQSAVDVGHTKELCLFLLKRMDGRVYKRVKEVRLTQEEERCR